MAFTCARNLLASESHRLERQRQMNSAYLARFAMPRWVLFSVSFALIGLLTLSGWSSLVSASEMKVLHSFCIDPEDACPDGSMPTSGLVRDANGNLFGTTEEGGNSHAGT